VDDPKQALREYRKAVNRHLAKHLTAFEFDQCEHLFWAACLALDEAEVCQ